MMNKEERNKLEMEFDQLGEEIIEHLAICDECKENKDFEKWKLHNKEIWKKLDRRWDILSEMREGITN
jgi:hypothetical protein